MVIKNNHHFFNIFLYAHFDFLSLQQHNKDGYIILVKFYYLLREFNHL